MESDPHKTPPVLEYGRPEPRSGRKSATHQQIFIVMFVLAGLLGFEKFRHPHIGTVQDLAEVFFIPVCTAIGLYHLRKHRAIR